MIDEELYKIFKMGSKTYFYSSVLFPAEIRRDVFSLYGFVRTADDFVDAVPQKAEEFYNFRERYENAVLGKKTGDVVIDSFVELMHRKEFEKEWVDSFLSAMEMDLTVTRYKTVEDVEKYMHGSAEVVGLLMSRIMGLDRKANKSAMLLGKAMQYINFIRDIEEDWNMGRTYFPQKDFKKYGIGELDFDAVKNSEDRFGKFVKFELNRYRHWQGVAEKGFKYIPKRLLIPIATASEMYKWTANQIEKEPLVVYRKKIKPSVPRILALGSMSAIGIVVRQ